MKLADFLETAKSDPDYVGDHDELLGPVHGAKPEQVRASYARPVEPRSRVPITVASLVHDRRQFELHLSESLRHQQVECETLIEWNSDNHYRLAKFYNHVLDAAKHDRILLCHPDIEFSPDTLLRMSRLFDDRPECGAVGLVGTTLARRFIWSGSQRQPKSVSTLDSCAIMVDRRQNLRFDEQTFDGFHCVVEDYCLQAQCTGRSVCVAAPIPFAHWNGSCLDHVQPNKVVVSRTWNADFHGYFAKLERKWPQMWFCTTAGGWGGAAREILPSYLAMLRASQKSPLKRIAKAFFAPIERGVRLLRRRKAA
jgi:hypothetical protein